MAENGTYWQKIEQVADQLATAKRILFITGAGISAESGLPTYRGIGGLYDGKVTEHDIPIEEALSGFMMRNNPRLTWRYISEIEQKSRGALHNAAHQVIAEIEDTGRRVCVLTQNVDGFHVDAGSQNVIEIHGNLRTLICPKCAERIENVDYSGIDLPPDCPNCGTIMRPDVILFGEFLEEKKISQLSAELARGFDVVFSVGTSSLFPYISAPVIHAAERGIPTVEINPAETDISSIVATKIGTGAVQAMRDIWGKIK